MDDRQAFITLSSADNVGVATQEIPQGAELSETVTACERIPVMHKIALADIAEGQPIVKFGHLIGVASARIRAGQHIHSHNCSVPDAAGSPQGVRKRHRATKLDQQFLIQAKSSFQGYPAGSSDRMGTRNFVGIIPTVNCAVSASRHMATHAQTAFPAEEYENFDGFQVLAHTGGCGGMDINGKGYENLLRALSGYAANPNFGAVVIVGLGCEVMQVAHIVKYANRQNKPVHIVEIQRDGGTQDAVAKGIAALKDVMPYVLTRVRRPCDVSQLIVGLQCGGSDSFSGITANPALGRAMDILTNLGGTAILSETPEIVGAEYILLNRCKNKVDAEKLRQLVKWWHNHVATFGGALNNNPSPGNKAGGLTTILEKSLGAVSKSGSVPVSAVYDYAERITAHGLVFMDSPGYDPVSVTGQIAGGANLIAFTTGRGSAFGAKPVPVLKLGSNTNLFHRQNADIDLDCGRLVSGDSHIDVMGLEIYNMLVDVASGKPTKSELLGYGDEEFVPWHLGPVL